MLNRSLHGGHLLLLVLTGLVLFLGLRAWGQMRISAPDMPLAAPPQMADAALLARVDPFFAQTAQSSAPVTALSLSLHGLRSEASTGRGSAIIATANGEQKVFDVGDMVESGVKLVAIAQDHVILDHQGQRESLWLDAGGDAPVQRFAIDAAPEMPADTAIADEGGLPMSDAPEADLPITPGRAVMPAVPALSS